MPGGGCCPAEANVWPNGECKWNKPTDPNGWQLKAEPCCVEAGGNWRTTGTGGECCMGKWKTECSPDGCHTHCGHHPNTWEQCDKCREEKCPWDACQKCQEKKRKCCADELIFANKTACLDIKACSDNSIEWKITSNHGNEYERQRGTAACGTYTGTATAAKIYDNTPQCMECWGPHCESKLWDFTARCKLDEYSYESGASRLYSRIDKSRCETLGATWFGHQVGETTNGDCYDMTVTSALDCFKKNIFETGTATDAQALAAMKNVSKLDQWKIEQIKLRTGLATAPMPEYVKEEGDVDIGCFKDPTTGQTCATGFHYDSWRETCRKDNDNRLKAACTAAGGDVFVEVRVRWEHMPMNQATCGNGRCEGSLRETSWFASWSPAQCSAYSKKSCSRSCRVCTATGTYADGVSGSYPTGGEHVVSFERRVSSEESGCLSCARGGGKRRTRARRPFVRGEEERATGGRSCCCRVPWLCSAPPCSALLCSALLQP